MNNFKWKTNEYFNATIVEYELNYGPFVCYVGPVIKGSWFHKRQCWDIVVEFCHLPINLKGDFSITFETKDEAMKFAEEKIIEYCKAIVEISKLKVQHVL